jgi:hypothetical protein
MRISEPSQRTKRWLRWLGAASSLIFVLACFAPEIRLAYYSPVEDSWLQVLHFAFLNKLQFGREIIFTFGPWGFLYGSDQPGTHLISLLTWLALGTLFWWAGRRVARLAFENEWARWAWLMAAASLSGIRVFSILGDMRLMSFPLLLLTLHFLDTDRSARVVRGALLVSLGLLSLVKFSALIVIVVIVLAVSADTIWRRRRFPWSFPAFAGSFLLFWLLAGQRLGSLGPYLSNSLQIASGYTEAMMTSSPHEMEFATAFLLSAALLVAILAFALWKPLRSFAAIPVAAAGFVLFTAFKHGFVRNDEHQAVAAMLLLLLALLVLAMVWPIVRPERWPLKIGGILPVVTALLYTICSFDHIGLTPFSTALVHTFKPQKWLVPIKQLYNGKSANGQYQRYLTYFRDQFPLPPLKSDTDVYSFDQMALFANALAYHPRPVFQSYSAYTSQLAELNAAHLRSDDAPSTVVLDGFTIDDRYSLLDDALSWPELLTRYDVQQVETPFAVLTRSKSPRAFKLTPLQDASIKLGERFSLPPTTNTVVWAQIEIQHTPAGSLASALFKPQELTFNTILRSGEQHTNRLIPDVAREGFILSPFVQGAPAWAAVASAQWPTLLTDSEVVAFSIVPANDVPPLACYKDTLRIRLYGLNYPRQDLEAVPGFKHALELIDVAQRASLFQPGRLSQPARLRYFTEAGSVLAVPYESALLLDCPRASHLRLGFGMHFLEGDQGAHGFTFRAFAVNARRELSSLWSRHLDPAANSGDRGNQQVTLDLAGQGFPRLLLQTIPDGPITNETICPFWSEVHFE